LNNTVITNWKITYLPIVLVPEKKGKLLKNLFKQIIFSKIISSNFTDTVSYLRSDDMLNYY